MNGKQLHRSHNAGYYARHSFGRIDEKDFELCSGKKTAWKIVPINRFSYLWNRRSPLTCGYSKVPDFPEHRGSPHDH
jgi:hypothetical protein